MNINLRWYQEGAIESVYDYFGSGARGNPAVALPTGSGKGVVIGGLNTRILQTWPGQRLLNLTHVKELIDQNYLKTIEMWPDAPAGVYSAGLGKRDTSLPIIFGGIQSVAKQPEAFGHRDLVLVDEAHLINPKEGTQYSETIGVLKRINPNLKVVGFTATWFRMGQGLLTDPTVTPGGIVIPPLFTDICYNQCGLHEFNRLINEGFLSTPIPKQTSFMLNVEGVATNGLTGDFAEGQLQAAVDHDDITYNALVEILREGKDRHCGMIFCAGVDHSEHVAKMLNDYFGVPAAAIHSKLSKVEIDLRFKAFKSGKLKFITGMNKFTTGFDHPPVDIIAILRPTKSTVLWVQMLGRGTRPYDFRKPGNVDPEAFAYIKLNCLVLDFAGNSLRLGPINDPVLPQSKKGGGGGGSAPVRKCEYCGTYNHPRATECIFCNEEFLSQPNIEQHASTDELVRTVEAPTIPVIEEYDVSHVQYNSKRSKNQSIPIFQATYYCGLNMFKENILFEHTGQARHRAKEWWRQRHHLEPPDTVAQANELTKELRVPKRIRVWVNKEFPEILAYEF